MFIFKFTLIRVRFAEFIVFTEFSLRIGKTPFLPSRWLAEQKWN